MGDPQDVAGWARWAAAELAAAGVPTPRADAWLLLAHVRGTTVGAAQADGVLGKELTGGQAGVLLASVRRRAAREPLQYITGVAPFRHRELAVGPGVFVPRPETEVLVDRVLDFCRSSGLARPVVVDLGTGSGAIAGAVATELPGSRVHAVELSPDAHRWARRNLEGTGVDLRLGDLAEEFADLDGTVDVVATNPPYIPRAEVPADVEVHGHDPAAALYGGPTGMEVPRLAVASAARLLRPGGYLIMEHTHTQGPVAEQALLAAGFHAVGGVDDLAGRRRFTEGLRRA